MPAAAQPRVADLQPVVYVVDARPVPWVHFREVEPRRLLELHDLVRQVVGGLIAREDVGLRVDLIAVLVLVLADAHVHVDVVDDQTQVFVPDDLHRVDPGL